MAISIVAQSATTYLIINSIISHFVLVRQALFLNINIQKTFKYRAKSLQHVKIHVIITYNVKTNVKLQMKRND